MLSDHSPPAARHHGLSLIEVVLVLSLLVVIAAVAMPFLGGAFSRAHLNSASDVLRDGWSRARVAAMNSGDTHVFRFEPNGSRYQILPLDHLTLPETATLPAADTDAEYSAYDLLRIPQARLPENVVFHAADIAPSSQLAALLGGSNDEAWSAPIVFNPDGTTSDASVVLKNDRDETVRLTLRGLTGIATASDVNTEVAP